MPNRLRHQGGHRPLSMEYVRSTAGFAMVTTLLLLMLLTTSATTALIGSGLQTRISSNLQRGLQATYLAEAGIQQAMYQLGRNIEWRTGIAETPLGQGTYSVTVHQPVPTADISLIATGTAAGAERTITVSVRHVLNIVAGTGVAGYSGDDGPATAAQLQAPTNVFGDSAGNLFIADRDNHRIRKVAAITGTISTVAGTGTAGYSGDGGAATAAMLYRPTGVCVDSAGNLFIADQDNHRIRKVAAATGTMSTVAGTGTAGYSGDALPATLARLNKPTGVYVDASNNIFIADQDNHRIRKVAALLSLMSTVAGTGAASYSGDGLLATLASINKPFSVFADSQGNPLIADQDNHRIRKVEGLLGIISTVAGTGVAADGGTGDIPTATALNFPNGVYADASGNFYIADTNNNRVRKTLLRIVRWQGA
jgi:sugar lactone lactonase YvrE